MNRLGLAVLGLVAVACRENEPVRNEAAAVDQLRAARASSGLLFDPATVRVGDKIGDLTLARLETRTAYDGTVLGSAHFSGEIRLTGNTFRHPEFPDVSAVCFEADSASAQRLPRWTGDTRRAWFCMSNSERAATLLAPPGEIRPADIVVGEYLIHRGASDEVNSAKLLRVISLP